jgi:DNA-binding NtrC family response regulator
VLDRDRDGRPRAVAAYERFAAEVREHFEVPGVALATRRDPAFLFAYGYQTRRAFHFVFRQIHGASLPAARLRAAVWQSIFTADRARYRRALVDRVHDVPTLVTGPTGTGKELVARAIGHARFIPFDAASRTFAAAPASGFFALNLSALAPSLVESELFGHRRGAYTGALEDREGWLEACGRLGTVFLDEVGELAPAIQVKLLRVLQTRGFQRLGETQSRRFAGKLVAATNRDLAAEMRAGAFRADFYWRLCADWIRTPSLREQLDAEPGDLRNLLGAIAARLFGAEEAPAIAAEVEAWIEANLPADYAWPGNIRELEQCVRSVVVRGSYRPPGSAAPGGDPRAELLAAVAAGRLGAEELLRRYTTLVYHRAGSYEEAARRLGVDRRTVKARVDEAFLAALGRGEK